MTTPATITFTRDDLDAMWWHAWIKEWRDLGKLHHMRETEQHTTRHEPPKWLSGVPWCECFYCRVDRAWQKRHEPVCYSRRSK